MMEFRGFAIDLHSWVASFGGVFRHRLPLTSTRCLRCSKADQCERSVSLCGGVIRRRRRLVLGFLESHAICADSTRPVVDLWLRLLVSSDRILGPADFGTRPLSVSVGWFRRVERRRSISVFTIGS